MNSTKIKRLLWTGIAIAVWMVSSHYLLAQQEQGLAKSRETKLHNNDYRDPLPCGAVARLGTARFRHNLARFAVFSPDGKMIASWGSTDGKRYDVLLWETATGRQLRRLAPVCMPSDPDHSHYSPMAFSPDGRLLATGGTTDFNTPHHKEWVELWEVASGKRLRRIPFSGPDDVYCLAFSPDGKTLAVADHSKNVQLVEVSTGKEQKQLSLVPNWSTKGLRFAPDGKLLAFGNRIFTRVKREKWVATHLEVRRAATGKIVVKVPNPQPRDIYCRFTFSSDAKTAVICNRKSLLSVWDSTTGKQLRRWQPVQSRIGHLALAPDGTTLAILNGGAIQLWNVATGQRLDRTNVGPGPVVEMALSADGRMLATRSLDHHDRIQLWDTVTRQQVNRYQHSEPIHCLALSADGRLLAAGSKVGIALWPPAAPKKHRTLRGATWSGSPNSFARGVLAFSPDGKTLAVANRRQFELSVWDTARGVKVLQKPGLYLSRVALSPDGKLIAGGGRTRKGNSYWVALWDSTGQELHRFTLGGQGVAALAFSADGKTLVAGLSFWRQAATLRAWDTTSGRELASYNQPASISCLALSPDGKTIAAVDVYQTRSIYLWEVASGKKRGQLRGHDGAVTSIAFFPTGKLISASKDRSVLFWDLSHLNGKALPVNLSRQKLEALYADLVGDDAIRAYQSLNVLNQNPSASVSFLKHRLRPAVRLDPAKVAQLIKDLDAPEFATRKKASAELQKFGGVAVPALKKVLEKRPTLEVRRRVQELLAKAQRRFLSGEHLATWRAIEVLERMGTQQARKLLEMLAQGAPGHCLTVEANAALQRVAKRSSSP